MGFIKKLQNKPEHERRRILLVTSIGLTLVVFLLWISSFYINVTGKNSDGTYTATPFDGLKSIFNEAKERFSSK